MSIEQFLMAVRARLNRAVGIKVIFTTLALGVIAALVAATVYRVQGYQVPWQVWAYPVGGAAVLSLLIWMVRLRGLDASARMADNHFDLKDSLLSALHFRREGREGEVYDLQWSATEEKIEGKDPKAVPFGLPTRALFATIVGAGLLAWLASQPASEAVQSKMAAKAQLEERTGDAAEQLEEFVEELLKDLDDEEREVLNPEELKQWVRDLEATGDEKDALRQFAKLEQKINKAMAGLEAKQDEAVLKLAAAELNEADISELRQLAKLLDAKEFKLAEEKLQELEHKEGDPRNEENMKKFEKLREATKRMNAGANKRRFSKNKAKRNNGNGQPKKLEEQAMDEMLEQLDEAADELEDGLEDMEMGEEMFGKLEKGMKGEMGKLKGRMRKLNAKKKMRDKLGKMRAGLGQCQGFAMGETQMLGLAQSNKQSPNPGGLKAGKGSVKSRRDARDEHKDNGNMTKLRGQQGEGPSQRTVEEADSGTGVASAAKGERKREFKKTFESFVHRDDIPESVKIGVREYFERIHEVQPAAESTTPEK